jgi:hypothetical protein
MRDRHETALRMRAEGATFQMIGEALAVTGSRAHAIYKRALVVRTEETAGLRTRSMGIVRSYPGCLEELAAIAREDHGRALVMLANQRNCSRVNAVEIVAWLMAGNRETP